jgi:TPR repeat protein
MYTNGLGVTQDDAVAASYHQMACDGGIPQGCFNLGTMFTYGIGVRSDSARAAALFRQACDAGLVEACR